MLNGFEHEIVFVLSTPNKSYSEDEYSLMTTIYAHITLLRLSPSYILTEKRFISFSYHLTYRLIRTPWLEGYKPIQLTSAHTRWTKKYQSHRQGDEDKI